MRKWACAVLVCVALAAAAAGLSGCGEDCCTVDSLPITLARAPLGGDGTAAEAGALLARASAPDVTGGAPFTMLLDAGSPVTVLRTGGPALQIQHRAFDLLDGVLPAPPPVRARFRNIGLLDVPLGPVGAEATLPLGVLGGDLMHAFSVELAFDVPCPATVDLPPGAVPGGCASLTLWRHIGPSSGFLGDAGYAVVRFTSYGGGEVNASGDPDLFGLRGPLELPPTRVVLRACAAPEAFTPDGPRQSCGARGCEVTRATGVDLSLMVATGVGPLVLGERAWARVAARLPAGFPVTMTPAPLLVATWPTPIAGPGPATGGMRPMPLWTRIPRLALVDAETGANDDLGPCVDLGRSRRLEWVSYHQLHPELAGEPCVEVCDTDPRESDKARNSAAYLEVGGSIPVAVVADDEPFLQSLRFDIRPEGPEIDGVIGAGALGPLGAGVRLELDYLNTPHRAIFSCRAGSDRAVCWAGARCPRLPDHDHTHHCFGLAQHGMPATCPAASPAVCE